ncbi:hypothetical protein CLI64_13915 [Nostoc sp. CENA543]|nr:hypothetical protein CLI64_13915 [Nostoc sp. CENA543]
MKLIIYSQSCADAIKTRPQVSSCPWDSHRDRRNNRHLKPTHLTQSISIPCNGAKIKASLGIGNWAWGMGHWALGIGHWALK